jgi:adenylate cyclase
VTGDENGGLPVTTEGHLSLSPRPTVAEWWRANRRRLLELWTVGIAVSVGVTAASALGYLDGAQARSLDLLMKLRDPAPVSDVVIVAVDESAFAALGHRQPLSRDYLAKVIRGVRRSGAAAVGLDIDLSTATSDAEDTALATAMSEFSDGDVSRVVIVSTERPPSGPLGRPELQRAVVRGVADMPEDSDGVIRRTNLVIRREVGLEPSFGLAVLARMGGLDQRGLQQALGKRGQGLRAPVLRPGVGWQPAGEPIDVQPDDLQRINFVGPAATFLTFPSQTLAALGEPGAAAPTDSPLKDRIVLIGATFADSRDLYETPHGKLSGVEIHANVVHMLATRSFIQPMGWVLSFGLQVLLVLVAGVLLTKLNPLAGTLICLVGAVAIGLPASYLIFERGHYWIDFMLPVFATRVLGWGVDVLDRPHFRKIVGRYVGTEAAASAPSERREVSIVVAGLPGLAALSEKMAPDEVAMQLGDYVAAMGEAIVHHDGVVDRVAGDVVMAVFGAPARPDHPVLAVRAAAAMQEALAALNERWTAAGLPRLRMTIGIHTGRVVAAGIGDAKSTLRYAAVGVDVEVALHVYALTTELDTAVTLITDATRAAVGDRMRVKDHGAFSMKQLGEEVRVYELLGREP